VNKVHVIGVGMTRFTTPKHSAPYYEMGAEAARASLQDAGIGLADIEQAFTSYIYGDSCCGQRTIYEVGMTGIPVINVNNNCSSGSTALFLARQLIASGALNCAIALGFEQMRPGAIGGAYPEKADPMEKFITAVRRVLGPDVPPAPGIFAGAALEYARRYGTRRETFARIAVKARRHGANNPRAVFRDPLTIEQVLESPEICDPITRFQCCPPTCGAAAAVLCSDGFATSRGIKPRVSIVAQSMTTDRDGTFETDSLIHLAGYEMSKRAAQAAYEEAGIGPEDMDVVELHDCFTSNELLTYEAIGLTPEGTAERFVWDGENTYGGRCVVNPSGGLLAKGHPSGATGIAQCCELVWQLRGEAEKRQVENARIALQHNLGLGGAGVVTLYAAV